MSQSIRELTLQWFDEVWNQRRSEQLDVLMDGRCIGSTESEGGTKQVDAAYFKQMHAAMLTAFPDLRIDVDKVVVEGDTAAALWHATGTHGGALSGLEATQAKIDVYGTTWLTWQDGRIVQGFDTWNLGQMAMGLAAASTQR